MMFKLLLISLFLLFVGYTLGDLTTSSSMTVTSTMKSLSSKASPDSKTTPNHQTTLIPTISPNPKTTSQSNPTTTLKAPNPKTTSHSNPKTTLKAANSKTTSHLNPKTTVTAAVTTKIATTMNTTVKNDGTTLNPRDNIHCLFYVIFLLLCVH